MGVATATSNGPKARGGERPSDRRLRPRALGTTRRPWRARRRGPSTSACVQGSGFSQWLVVEAPNPHATHHHHHTSCDTPHQHHHHTSCDTPHHHHHHTSCDDRPDHTTRGPLDERERDTPRTCRRGPSRSGRASRSTRASPARSARRPTRRRARARGRARRGSQRVRHTHTHTDTDTHTHTHATEAATRASNQPTAHEARVDTTIQIQ